MWRLIKMLFSNNNITIDDILELLENSSKERKTVNFKFILNADGSGKFIKEFVPDTITGKKPSINKPPFPDIFTFNNLSELKKYLEFYRGSKK